jgi:hypothetical protein
VTITFLIFLVILVWFREDIGRILSCKVAAPFFEWWERR